MQITIELLNIHALRLLQELEQMRIIRISGDSKKQEYTQTVTKKKRQFGVMKGLVVSMTSDFNAPLEDFNE
jgi:Protein of unknown function (DUF2281)